MTTLKFIFAVFVSLCIVKGGLSKCTLSDLSVTQTAGNEYLGVTEYQVSIRNGCNCTQSHVVFQCAGFNSILPVDKNFFKPTGSDQCLVNNGEPIFNGDTINFSYVSPFQVALSPRCSEIACSSLGSEIVCS